MTTGMVKAKGKGTILSHALTENAVHRLNVGGPSMLGIRYSRSCMHVQVTTIVARPKLKGIDGKAPPGVEFAA